MCFKICGFISFFMFFLNKPQLIVSACPTCVFLLFFVLIVSAAHKFTMNAYQLAQFSILMQFIFSACCVRIYTVCTRPLLALCVAIRARAERAHAILLRRRANSAGGRRQLEGSVADDVIDVGSEGLMERERGRGRQSFGKSR